MKTEITIPVEVENVEFADAALAGFRLTVERLRKEVERLNSALLSTSRHLSKIAEAQARLDSRERGGR